MVDKRAYSYHVQRVSDCEMFIPRWDIYITTPTGSGNSVEEVGEDFQKTKIMENFWNHCHLGMKEPQQLLLGAQDLNKIKQQFKTNIQDPTYGQ